MTDKEPIIINNVNVCECNRLIVNQLYGYVCNCEEDKHLISSCKNRPNCHFKQLARKTAECDSLREALKEERIYKRTYLKSLLDCKEECKELKDYAQRQENQRETYYKKFLKKSKALEEIEEFIKNQSINNKWNMRIQRFKSEILKIIRKAKEN